MNDISRSLAFYSAIGYKLVGKVFGAKIGDLTLLSMPGDEFVTMELIEDPGRKVVVGNGFNHLAVQVDSLSEVLHSLSVEGFQPGEIEFPGGLDGPQTSQCADPDGYLIELTQWPAGHPAGISELDFA